MTPGGSASWLCGGSLDLCNPLADDPLLPVGDRGAVLFHVVTTVEGRKSGWLLEVADVDTCLLIVKYGDGKNCYNLYIMYEPVGP